MTVITRTDRRIPMRFRILAAVALAAIVCVEVCAELGYAWAIAVRIILIGITVLVVALTVLASPVFIGMALIERRKAAQEARQRAVKRAEAARQGVLAEQSRAAAKVAELHDEVIGYASRITVNSHQAEAVIGNAEPLLEWLREARTVADVEARRAALRRQYFNRVAAECPRDDDPRGFLAEATQLYAFAQGGKRTEVTR